MPFRTSHCSIGSLMTSHMGTGICVPRAEHFCPHSHCSSSHLYSQPSQFLDGAIQSGSTIRRLVSRPCRAGWRLCRFSASPLPKHIFQPALLALCTPLVKCLPLLTPGAAADHPTTSAHVQHSPSLSNAFSHLSISKPSEECDRKVAFTMLRADHSHATNITIHDETQAFRL